MRKQKAGEAAESFIRALHKLSVHCDYSVLKDELIRDCIVAGIHKKKLPENSSSMPIKLYTEGHHFYQTG